MTRNLIWIILKQALDPKVIQRLIVLKDVIESLVKLIHMEDIGYFFLGGGGGG